jgi:gas vesicle protein
MNTEKVLLGALAGFATGALLGIFFAPQKGSDLRKKIGDQSRDYANDLKEKFSNFVDSLNTRFESAKDEAGNLIDQGKNTLDHAKKDLKATAQKSDMSTSGTGTY